MFRLLKIENARMNVPEPEYLEVTDGEAVAEGEALMLASGKLTKCGATTAPQYIAMGVKTAADTKRTIPVCRVEKNQVYADVIVVDPPRKGCDSVCLDTILKMAPKKVVYVSCDSSTLARDVKYLCENGYEVKRVRPVDMFPMSGHVETVCRLDRK